MPGRCDRTGAEGTRRGASPAQAAEHGGARNDLLLYARIGDGTKQLETVDLEEVFDQCRSALEQAIAESSAVIDHARLPVVTGHRVQLFQLLQNPLSNAIKFARPGQPAHVRVSVTEDEEAWMLTVKDDGIGIDPIHHERIFHLFERLHSRSAFPGTGIGLALCRKIAHRHGGRVWLESAVGSGTTVHVTLARPRPPETP